MHKFSIVALLFLAGTIHAETRAVPVMYPQACATPPVLLPTPWPEVRANAGNCPGGQCTGEACRCDGQGQACQACPARSQNATTVDLPGVVLAVGQCPGGQCPVPQRGAVMGYSYPTIVQPMPEPRYVQQTVDTWQTPQPVATVYAAERPRLFGRLFAEDRPRLFRGLFAGKLFGGKCCGK